MSRTIEVLLIIGIFVNLIKGADLVLRPHQQKWLQLKCDSLALWLDYTRPLKWYEAKQGGKKLLIIFDWLFGSILFLGGYWLERKRIYLVLAAAFSLLVVNGIRTVSNEVKFQEWLIKHITMEHYPIHSPFDYFLKLNRWIEIRVNQWLFKSDSISDYLLRPLVVCLLGVFSVASMLGILRLLFYFRVHFFSTSSSSEATPLFYPVAMLCGGLAVLIGMLTFEIIPTAIGCVFILAFTLLLLSLESLLQVGRAIVWRIAEYSKGAFAAILLLVTVLLGVAEAYFRFLKQ